VTIFAKIVWIGHFRGYSGFAVATREYFKSIKPYFDNLFLASLESLDTGDPFKSYMITEEINDIDLKVVNHLPTTDPEAEAYFSVWEYNKIPDTWIEILENAKVVMTQSNYCKSIFSKHISNSGKIHIIPYIIPREFSPNGPKLRLFDENLFVYGSVFEWVPRKVPELMIEAFTREFKPNEPVRLILKTQIPYDINSLNQSNFHDNPIHNSIIQVLRLIKQDPRILIFSNPIPNISDFYRGLNAYISCTAGEGWGQTLSESMACGIPTIGSNHSGNLDFMNSENSYLVEVENWSPTVEFPNLCWKKPKIESIQKIIRQVYEQYNSKSQRKIITNAIKIKEKYTSENIGYI
jgi:glycosyltransferase involved in cell wall biosynthesis